MDESEFRSNLDSPKVLPLSSGTNSISQKRKAGRKKFRETRHPIYLGIRQRDSGKWICEVREPKKKTRIWVGTYPTPELAARAYDVAALALRGKIASLNFPDSAWLVPRAKSGSAQDIRLAAFQATRFEFVSFSSPSSSSSSSYSAKSEEQEVEASRSCDMGFMGKTLEDSKGLFLDEEAIFNMPGLIASMAEGMLLTPPPLRIETCWNEIDESANSFIDLECLW